MNQLQLILRRKIECHPTLFELCYKYTGKSPDLLASNDTDLVLEGFPRSANTYSLYAFYNSQSEKMKIRGHTHSPGNVLLALKYNVPTCVLIRKPHDAVKSLLVRNPQYNQDQVMNLYLSFYDILLPRKDDFVIAKFEEATEDFNKVINRLNKKYLKQFGYLSDDEKTRTNIAESLKARNGNRGLKYSYTPDSEREYLKASVKITNHKLLSTCNKLYELFTTKDRD